MLIGFTEIGVQSGDHYKIFFLKVEDASLDEFDVFYQYRFKLISRHLNPCDTLEVRQITKRKKRIGECETFQKLLPFSKTNLMDIFPVQWSVNKEVNMPSHEVGLHWNDLKDDEINVVQLLQSQVVVLQTIKKECKLTIARRFKYKEDGEMDWLNASLQVILKALDFEKKHFFSSSLGLILLGMSKSLCPKDGFDASFVRSILLENDEQFKIRKATSVGDFFKIFEDDKEWCPEVSQIFGFKTKLTQKCASNECGIEKQEGIENCRTYVVRSRQYNLCRK